MFLIQRSQQEWAKNVADNPLSYPRNVVPVACDYLADLSACGNQSLGISSPEVNKAWASGDRFWEEFSRLYQGGSK